MQEHQWPGRRRGSARRLADYVRDLAVPVPFDLDEFRSWLERRDGHRVRLVPSVMEPGAPSGIFLRRVEADYLYYREQASAFHQAHIVLCLAAHMLLGKGTGPSVSSLLVPHVRPHVVRLMLGDLADSTMTRAEAEAFAFLVLDQERPAYPPVLARRDARRLRPLRAALLHAVPEATGAAMPGVRPAGRARLHLHIVEIRDAALALRPYRDPLVALDAAIAARRRGLAGDDLAAAAEAAVLAAAMDAKAAADPRPEVTGDYGWEPIVGRSLRSEAAWLVKVANAFSARLQVAGEVHGGNSWW